MIWPITASRLMKFTLPLNELDEYDKRILSTQLKAYIARNIWNDDGFFPVIHKIDYTFQKAIMK